MSGDKRGGDGKAGDKEAAAAGTPEPKPGDTSGNKPSGRPGFDERGQAVWEWSVKTGMFDRNASTQRIRKLLETDLQVDDAARVRDRAKPGATGDKTAPPSKGAPAPASRNTNPAAPKGPSFNPYDSGPPPKKNR